MATEIVEKKKHDQEQVVEGKSKGLNTFLWILSVAFFTAAAIGNVYFKDAFSLPVRVVGVVVALLIAFGLAAITNQGTKARTFFREAKVEARKVVWPTRAETRQTTLIVIGVTVLTSLFFWAIDSIIIALINFLTDLRF
ncbi:preprotein translocase subunit SecE [Haemophilus sp.]|jgi:preprotein translocase, secE subunit|uniref:preprotein translocase subunit SecE n=1 Tax=Haemophilus sp. TaxID=740 RepID=UPI00352026B6